MNQTILEGIRILDFTRVLAGPFATRLLADFGAEVIKVQCGRLAQGTESNLSGYFHTYNRNKKSITLDLDHREARDLALRLAARSDVVVENFTPRVMANWGLTYPAFQKIKRDIIMVSISGAGQSGPWKDLVAFGPTLHALSGLTYLTSYTENEPAGPGYPYADAVSGLYGALTILGALEFRDRTGQGQHIDLSQYEAMCAVLGPALLDCSANRKNIDPQGNRAAHISAAPYGCYKCRGEDRWCAIAVSSDEEWRAFSEALGNPEWAAGYSTREFRGGNAAELDKKVGAWTAVHTPEEVFEILQKRGIRAGIVQNARDLAEDEQLAAREFFRPLAHPLLGSATSDSSPLKMEDAPAAEWKPAPLLGEHNQYVFRELLGMEEEEFSGYMKRGIIA